MLKFLKPAPGLEVPQPDGNPWPAEGMDAPDTLFVRRRIRDGDLIEAERPADPVVVEEGAIVDPAGDAGSNPPAGDGKKGK
jgi:hypothetical protein